MDNATLIERLRTAWPGAIGDTNEFRRQLSVYVKREAIVDDAAAAIRDSAAHSVVEASSASAVAVLGHAPKSQAFDALLSEARELLAEARGKRRQEIGYYRLRAPVKPIMLCELAALPKTDEATNAVVRG